MQQEKAGTFLTFITDIAMVPFDDITYKPMRGGVQLLKKRLEFGIVKGDTLYLYADKKTIGYYEFSHSKRYTFTKKSGAVVETDYWSVPVRVVSNTKDFGQWVSDAFLAASRRRKKKEGAK